MSKVTKIVLPAQNVLMDDRTGVNPTWYEKFSLIAGFVSLFSEIDPTTLTNGQVLIWDAATKKFKAGSN